MSRPACSEDHEYTDAETGFVYLRARYYDPATGQFISRDPLVALTGSAYGYVYGNPLNLTDPLGLWGLKSFVRAVAFSAAAVGAVALVAATAGLAAPVIAGAAVSWGAIGVGAAAVSTVAGVANAYYSCREDGPASCASAIIGTALSAVGGGLAGGALRLATAGTEGAAAAGQGLSVLGGGFGGASDVYSMGTGFYSFMMGGGSSSGNACDPATSQMHPGGPPQGGTLSPYPGGLNGR